MVVAAIAGGGPPARRWSRPLLWAAALAALSLTIGNHALGLAAWAGPPLLLAFTRRGAQWPALAMGALAMASAQILGWRGALPLHGATYFAVTAGAGLAFFLPYAIDRLTGGRLGGAGRLLLFPSAWVVVEYLVTRAGQGSWGAIAYAHLDSPALLQLAAVTGLSGITFLNGLVATALLELWERRSAPVLPGLVLGGLALVLLAGSLRLAAAPQAATVRAAGIVVDNADAFRSSWGPLVRGKGLDAAMAEQARPVARRLYQALLDASRREARAGARLIVWSEANALVLADDEPGFLAVARTFAAAERVYLFLGMAVITPGRPLAENKLVVVDPAGRLRASYRKSHPTPGEASIRGAGRLGWIDTPHGRIAWAICYDLDYPELVAQAGRAGAGLLVAPAWDDAGMTPLHARMATLRAIENGAALFRPANGGLSLASDGRGVVLAQAMTVRRGVLVADLPVRRRAAPYAALGDLVPALAAILLLGLVLRRYSAAIAPGSASSATASIRSRSSRTAVASPGPGWSSAESR